MNYKSRLDRVREAMSLKGLNGFIIFNRDNIRYISGFSGSSAVIFITPQKAFFLTDFRYKVQANKEVKDFEIIIYKIQTDAMLDLINSQGLKTIGFESEHVIFSLYEEIKNDIKCDKFVPESSLTENIRAVKEEEEIELIKKSVNISRQGLEEVKHSAWIGLKELDLAVELEYMLRKGGSETIPFDIIVASGDRSAMPHAAPCEKILIDKDLVVIDYGSRYNGYNSDITRSFVLGRLESRHKDIYDIVLSANKEAIKSVKPGVTASFIDKTARDLIAKEGYKDFFGHGTGHGIGLEVHECPGIKRDDDTIIKEGMVFTIEPGIYIPDVGGVRIEDMVVVTRNGCEVLTDSLSKELTVIDRV